MHWNSRCCLLSLLAVFMWLPGRAQAEPSLRQKLEDLAGVLLQVTAGGPVQIGTISGDDASHNAGPGIEEQLKRDLEAKKPGSVGGGDAPFLVKGEYFAGPDPDDPKLILLQLDLTVIRRADRRTLEKRTLVARGIKDIAKGLQATARITPPAPPDAPPRQQREKAAQRNEELQQAQRSPSVLIEGARIGSTAQSPYRVEVQAGAEGLASPLTPVEHEGQAFVELTVDDVYQLEIHNLSNEPVAVAVSIDGLDVFHFMKDRNRHGDPLFTHHVIGPGSTGTISGWYDRFDEKTGKGHYRTFLVTEYGRGAVSEAGMAARGRVGVIHVQFCQCRELKRTDQARSGKETGFGPPVEVQQKLVRLEIDPPHDFVTVRYDR